MVKTVISPCHFLEAYCYVECEIRQIFHTVGADARYDAFI